MKRQKMMRSIWRRESGDMLSCKPCKTTQHRTLRNVHFQLRSSPGNVASLREQSCTPLLGGSLKQAQTPVQIPYSHSYYFVLESDNHKCQLRYKGMPASGTTFCIIIDGKYNWFENNFSYNTAKTLSFHEFETRLVRLLQNVRFVPDRTNCVNNICENIQNIVTRGAQKFTHDQ